MVERFLTSDANPKPTTADADNPMNQSELEANACNRCQARKTGASKSRWVLFLLLIGLKSTARYVSQSRSKIKEFAKLLSTLN